MLLINKVKINELNSYREEYLNCLKHNISNSIITKIIIWVDDPDHNIPKLSSKVDVFFKKDQSIFNSIEVSKKLTPEEIIIFSHSLCKFNHDLFKIKSEVIGQTVVTDGGNYFIFTRNCQLSDVGQIGGIFPLTRKTITLQVERQNLVKISHKSSREVSLEKKPIIQRRVVESVNFPTIKKRSVLPKEEFISQKIIKRKGVVPKVESIKRSKKLDVVIVSVNYNDLLIVSLSHNVKIFENITVVTSPDDLLCQKICQKFGVHCVVTGVMYEDGAVFNKGRAINEGIKSIKDPDFILLIDADIVVESKIDIDSLTEDSLYTSSRRICKSYQVYKSWKEGDLDIEKVGRLENNKGIGFFQLFNISNSNIDRENPYPENSQNASWSDLIFRDKFPKRFDWGGNVIHLGDPYINWDGRVTSRFLTDEDFMGILNKKSTFTICSFYFNYNNDLRQKRNFIKFIEQWKDHYQNMIVGIVDYGDIDFEIPCEKIIIEGDVNKRIWSKEILINKIVEKIDTDYILWIDGDIIYEDLSWLNNLDGVIGDNDFVQLFETINYLGENGEVLESHKSLVSAGTNNVDQLLGKGYKPGGSWLGKVKVLKDKKLFEKMLVGGGDTILVYALFGVEGGWTLRKVREGSEEVYQEAKKWILEFGKKKVGYLPVTVNHLYHGDLKDRNYNERYKNLENKLIKNKIVVYTCISGNYDKIKDIINKEENIDYICFSDQDVVDSNWRIKKIPEFLNYLDQTKRARCIKILPHLFLPEYEISIWIDGNIEVVGNVSKLVEKYSEEYFSIPKHPDRICIYQEAEVIIKMKKDKEENVMRQINKYRDSGYPQNFGLVQSNVIIRKHNHKICKDICENWWKETVTQSKRDQLSFNYSIWNKDYNINIINPSIIDSEFFNIWTHIQKGGQKIKVRRGYDSIKNYINGKEV